MKRQTANPKRMVSKVVRLATACGLLLGATAWGQDVTITNVTIAPRDKKTATIKFDIIWGDSWRHELNHDAAWVFFKVRRDAKAEWQHVRLAADKVLNPKGYGHGQGTRLEFLVPDGKDGFTGVFLRRAEYSLMDAVKTFGVAVVGEIKGLADLGTAEIRAFGVQMVYVADGSFCLGTGGDEINGFYRYTDAKQCTEPYRVTGSGAIPTGRQNGRLWARDSSRFTPKPVALPQDGGEIPATFPNGYAAFYCMRSSMTFVQYAEFMNVLTPTEAEARYSARAVNRNGEASNYTYTAQSGWRGHPYCQDLSWEDGAAWAAWAGLRPMTELEYEKAVRGPREPVPEEAGLSYWNLAGWLGWDWHSWHPNQQCERPVTVGNSKGRAFKGTHGDGTVKLPADWPQADAVGAGFRGSSSQTGRPIPSVRISDRLYSADSDSNRGPMNRWRGVRTAPREAEEASLQGKQKEAVE